MRVEASIERCQAYGNCVEVAEDVYDLVNGNVVVLLEEPPEEARERARLGARLCPVSAISIVE
ncbi:MAG: ferredoxin [Microbacterium sp.]|nr:ferredoxin [Microbacterium sp.]MDP3950938.1 ferredoxin [Microbacterium sp.]